MMKTREQRIEFDRNYCVHYKPKPGSNVEFCAIGCESSKLRKAAHDAGEPAMSPCIGGHTTPNVLAFCPKWERRSLEHAEKRADEIDAAIDRMMVVLPIVAKWRTWTHTNRVAKTEIIECPKCKGRLLLFQSEYNGHVRGTCETEGCVSWIE